MATSASPPELPQITPPTFWQRLMTRQHSLSMAVLSLACASLALQLLDRRKKLETLQEHSEQCQARIEGLRSQLRGDEEQFKERLGWIRQQVMGELRSGGRRMESVARRVESIFASAESDGGGKEDDGLSGKQSQGREEAGRNKPGRLIV